MEILPPEKYDEYERFVQTHHMGSITQSVLWHGVKPGWAREVIVSRDESGGIIGGASVLIRKMPIFGAAMMYCPRGPVCDIHDRAVLSDIKNGADELAKKYNAYTFKIDPEVKSDDDNFALLMNDMGFKNFRGGDGFETIQSRVNFRLYMSSKNEDEIFAGLSQKTRYNVRVAKKHGVEIKIVGEEMLDEFVRLMRITGERDGFSVRPKSYFANMLRELGECCRLYMAFYNGRAISGAITTNYAGKTSYTYGASDNEHRNVMPNYLLQWEMIRWAIETGCRVYDFHGVPANPSEGHPLHGLYRFKKGFGGTLDDGAGEYDYFYRPFLARIIDKAITVYELLMSIKRKMVKR